MGIYGEYKRSLDDRNRITIPSKLRDFFGSSFYLFRAIGNNIEMYNEASFAKLSAKISQLDEFSPQNIKYQRAFYARISVVEVDKAGRFLVPKELLNLAKINKELVIVGMNDKAIIWNSLAYEQFNSEMNDEDFTKLMSDISNVKK